MEKTLREEKNQRVVTFLNREEVDYLDKIGKDALFSTGLKLSRTKLIAWLVDFMKDLNIDGEGIKSLKDLEKRIIEIMGQETKGVSPTSPVRYPEISLKNKLSNGASHGTGKPR